MRAKKERPKALSRQGDASNFMGLMPGYSCFTVVT